MTTIQTIFKTVIANAEAKARLREELDEAICRIRVNEEVLTLELADWLDEWGYEELTYLKGQNKFLFELVEPMEFYGNNILLSPENMDFLIEIYREKCRMSMRDYIQALLDNR